MLLDVQGFVLTNPTALFAANCWPLQSPRDLISRATGSVAAGRP